MVYTNAQYANSENTSIRCDINGVTSYVPVTIGNSDYARIRDLIASGELTIAPYALPPAPPPTLTARQLRLGLLSLGIRAAQVEEAIASIPDEMTREAALIEWEYATTFDRKSELVASIGAALGLSESQIDDSWKQFARV